MNVRETSYTSFLEELRAATAYEPNRAVNERIFSEPRQKWTENDVSWSEILPELLEIERKYAKMEKMEEIEKVITGISSRMDRASISLPSLPPPPEFSPEEKRQKKIRIPKREEESSQTYFEKRIMPEKDREEIPVEEFRMKPSAVRRELDVPKIKLPIPKSPIKPETLPETQAEEKEEPHLVRTQDKAELTYGKKEEERKILTTPKPPEVPRFKETEPEEKYEKPETEEKEYTKYPSPLEALKAEKIEMGRKENAQQPAPVVLVPSELKEEEKIFQRKIVTASQKKIEFPKEKLELKMKPEEEKLPETLKEKPAERLQPEATGRTQEAEEPLPKIKAPLAVPQKIKPERERMEKPPEKREEIAVPRKTMVPPAPLQHGEEEFQKPLELQPEMKSRMINKVEERLPPSIEEEQEERKESQKEVLDISGMRKRDEKTERAMEPEEGIALPAPSPKVPEKKEIPKEKKEELGWPYNIMRLPHIDLKQPPKEHTQDMQMEKEKPEGVSQFQKISEDKKEEYAKPPDIAPEMKEIPVEKEEMAKEKSLEEETKAKVKKLIIKERPLDDINVVSKGKRLEDLLGLRRGSDLDEISLENKIKSLMEVSQELDKDKKKK